METEKERGKKERNTDARGVDGLANSFSVLDVEEEEEDNRHSASIPSSSSSSSASLATSSGEGINNDNGSGCVGEVKAGRQGQQDSAVLPLGSYKLPLVWIDLEMTGLDVESDRILEIACIITDGSLTKSVEGPDLVIHQSKECLDKMGEWCQTQHGASGLTKKVLHSTISEREAEIQVREFVKKNVGTYKPLLAGNSVYTDFLFLKKYMPDLATLFSHVLVDVSSINALCLRWYPKVKKNAPRKEKKHRALEDIRESIQELKYYKEHIFRAKSSNSKG